MPKASSSSNPPTEPAEPSLDITQIRALCKAARRAIHDFDMFQAGHFGESDAAKAINGLSSALVPVEKVVSHAE